MTKQTTIVVIGALRVNNSVLHDVMSISVHSKYRVGWREFIFNQANVI